MMNKSTSDTKTHTSLAAKAVSSAEPEGIPPIYSELGEPCSNSFSQSPKQHRVSGARRLTGRLNRPSLEQLPKYLSHGLTKSPGILPMGDSTSNRDQHDPHDPHSHLLLQVTEWLHEEKSKRLSRAPSKDLPDTDSGLRKLEKILAEHAVFTKHPSRSLDKEESYFAKRKPSSRKLRSSVFVPQPSDTEHHDGEPIVPTTDVALDNSKTVGYTDTQGEDNWSEFKHEIVRLTHTLRLKGWRRVPLDRGNEIDVQRLSGALTNAVYVVTPPRIALETPLDNAVVNVPRRSPKKLLLRIYGPNAEHLIDRSKELEVLKRLARKKIGPRLLGTFINGRFEQYLNARPLTPEELRDPEISRQIAKRMRELHEGIDLTIEERSAGPLLWQNWDKWVKLCKKIIEWLDEQITNPRKFPKSRAEAWRTRGLICGVPWSLFCKAVDNYRKWLEETYGGRESIRDHLVFAHNDTQYGNILRIEPAGESPLLLPANEHKQLVVIDFEYANANTPGLEFANHFTEWCYNYHDSTAPWACNAAAYPRPDEQRRFIRAYLQHHPDFSSPGSPTLTRNPLSVDGQKTNERVISDAKPTTLSGLGGLDPAPSPLASSLLDARQPRFSSSYTDLEKAHQRKLDAQVENLIRGTRLWRVANSAQWVAWGIVQAKVSGMEDDIEAQTLRAGENTERTASNDEAASSPSPKRPADILEMNGRQKESKGLEKDLEVKLNLEASRPPHDSETDGAGDEVSEEGEAEDEFDYLAYAQDRALFFWGDMLELGLVKEEELPGDLVERAKRISY